MAKGRIEQMFQKKFVLSRDKFELQLAYKSEEMNDVREEMKMLDSDEEDEKRNLKKKWNVLKEEKNKIYKNWVKFTEEEETRRDGVQIEWTNNEEGDAVTELTVPTSSEELKLSPNKNPTTISNKGVAEVSVSTAPSSLKNANSAAPGNTTNQEELPGGNNPMENNLGEDNSSSSSESSSDDDDSDEKLEDPFFSTATQLIMHLRKLN